MTGQADDIQWYIARDGKQHGPLTDVELRTFVAHSYLRPSDLIWRPGMSEWQPAPQVFPAAFQDAAASPPAAPPAPRAQATAPSAPPAAMVSPQSAARVTHAAAVQAAPTASRFDGNLIKRLALASAAIMMVGGGAFALATYHQPLMEMVSGSSEDAADDAPVVVAQPENGGQHAEAEHAQSTSSDGNVNEARAEMGLAAAHEDTAADAPSSSAHDAPPAPEAPTTTASVPSAAPDASKNAQVAMVAPEPPPASLGGSVAEGSSLDQRLQKVEVWELLKREYPDWYADQISSANKLVADKKSDNEVAALLAQGLVDLRRKNAEKALSASSEKLQGIAEAFLNHLKSLRAQSVSACFGFISKGETSPAVVQTMEKPETATALNAQAGAIFAAISEGNSNPVKHDSAVKSDYDVLIKELAKLGWKEEDLQVFSNPKLLAKREPDQVCKMVQEWFVAHLAVPDKAIRDRLLFETLKPVVSG
ncbi:GYF domain-containing protein [Hyphomicrobium methylovorum]|uniref:GYF domain-containing protein n=1 Tax=Hyphomicrobium methylovorum TaxID=84 RepID=UPI001FEC20E3|nr:GYF domain-containing protein [Hyphomicrobium methylovorum]